MNCVGWLLGGGIAPVLIGALALRMSLGNAIALSSVVYCLAGILLVVTMLCFLDEDINQLQAGKKLVA
jgi:hypothetical protein